MFIEETTGQYCNIYRPTSLKQSTARTARIGYCREVEGWLGEVKVSCSFCHWSAQLILAYGWARPAVLAAGKDIGRMLLFFLFVHFLSFPSFFPIPLFHLLYYIFSTISSIFFSPPLWVMKQNDPQGLMCC